MTPEDLERLGYGNEYIWLRLENDIMQDIARRIKDTGVITRTADYQLNKIQQLFGYSDAYMKDLVQTYLGESEEYITRVFKDAVKTEYIDNKKLYKAVGADFIPYQKNETIKKLVKDLNNISKQEMKNMSGSLGFVVDTTTGRKAFKLSDYYQHVLDHAIIDISSGGFDYQTTLRKTVKQMTNSGLRWIDYDSGYHNRVTVAARRSVMSSMGRLASGISNYNAKQLGTDTFEVAWHANARPSHRLWHGMLWTYDQLVSVCGLGTVEGLGGANCYHIYYPFIPGISVRNWSDEWLAEQSKQEDTPKTFRGKEYTGYEATQRQRTLETRMRAQKETIQLLKDNDSDPFDLLAVQSKYKASLDEYAKFSAAMGLRQQRERIYIGGTDNLLTNNAVTKINHLKQAMSKQLNKLTEEEKAVIKKMSGALSQKINYAINHSLDITKYKKEIELIDSALSKGKITKDIVLKRKTTVEFMLGKKDYDDKDMLNLCSTFYQNPIYTSTSLVDFDYDKRDVIIDLKVSKGFKGALYIKDLVYSKYKYQEEVLFKRNLIYHISKIEKVDDIWHLSAEVIGYGK